MEFIQVHIERVEDQSVRGFQEARDLHQVGPWRQDPVVDFLYGVYSSGCYEQLYIHAEILAAENTILRQKVSAVQDGFPPETSVEATIEGMADACVRRLQEERTSHQGGPWRKDPVADFIARLWVSSSYGALYNHAEIFAAENAALRRHLLEIQ